ncbi:unnamed protein product [Ilex paraguariensis]|uniref:Uncharacterized protein n=1 Tax=Ilex paraguariensis TaxID=185542 RepID=A0ABC8RQT4_9AQUA
MNFYLYFYIYPYLLDTRLTGITSNPFSPRKVGKRRQKMDGYSKIRLAKGTKSRSMDISDFSIFPETQKATETTSPNHTSKTHECKQIKSPNTHEAPSDSVYERGNGERFGMKLTRNSSVSSASSHMFKFEKQSTTTTLQSAVKRAFSMSRSSSVSERYCRIHDQCVTLASSMDDDDDIEAIDNNNEMERRSVKKKKHSRSSSSSSGRILKACKRLFGL